MFSFGKTVTQDELDTFKAQLDEKLAAIEQAINLKVSEPEEIVRKAAESAIEAEKRIQASEQSVENALKILETCVSESKTELEKIISERESLVSNGEALQSRIDEVQNLYTQALSEKAEVQDAVSEITGDIEKIREILDESKELPESVEAAKEVLDESKQIDEKIRILLSHSMKRKGEIDELHREICGHDIKNDEGNSEHIDGLKDELASAYENTVTKISGLELKIKETSDSISAKHVALLTEQRESYEDLILKSRSRIDSINEQLNALLPGAMAAGLSAAYEAKKKEETDLLENHEKKFGYAILMLAAISLIPFGVDTYLLGWKSHDLVQVIKETPSLILAIFPLYFPVLWMAHSANKKVNLSKRLIEEYTHKSVLGKTFSGLSNQIESLPHEGIVRDELRTRLLFNVLQVSAENPGKLITDYKKSDHPLMEALENSSKLSDSIESLAKIPGFSAVAKKLASIGEKIIDQQTKKVEQGIAAQNSLDEEKADKLAAAESGSKS